MKTFLICFELSNNQRETELVSLIKESDSWARIMDNIWCVRDDDKTTAEIRERITSRVPIYESERLMVFNITGSAWASFNLPKQVTEWLKKKPSF